MPEDESVTVEGAEEEQAPAPDKESAPRKTVAVKVIAEKDGSALVEWVERDDLRRCYLPADEVATGKASREALDAGIPYGIAWEDHLGDLPKSMARTLGAELRRRGVWCEEDLTNARAVKHAIGKAVGNIYTLLKAAAQEV